MLGLHGVAAASGMPSRSAQIRCPLGRICEDVRRSRTATVRTSAMICGHGGVVWPLDCNLQVAGGTGAALVLHVRQGQFWFHGMPGWRGGARSSYAAAMCSWRIDAPL